MIWASQTLSRVYWQGLSRLLVIVFLWMTSQSVCAQTTLQQLRVGQDAQKTRVVVQLQGQNVYQMVRLHDPERLEIVFAQGKSALGFGHKQLKDPRLQGLQIQQEAAQTKLVLHLVTSVQASEFLMAEPKRDQAHLVIDLFAKADPPRPDVSETGTLSVAHKPSVKSKAREQEPEVLQAKQVIAAQMVAPAATEQNSHLLGQVSSKPLVVALDAGHGGKDSGAINAQLGLQEKQVTLQIAQRLKQQIDALPGMRAVLTRDRDVYIPLHERVQIAKAKGADIFVSIHADAFADASVKGGSIYVLSRKGASSSMARLLAKSENAYVQSVDLNRFDQDVAYALSDLSRQATINHSRKLADAVLAGMREQVVMHRDQVQSAGFAVLKSIDIPSMLIETAFISNPNEARNLMNPQFQQKMALAIAKGLSRYVDQHQPAPIRGPQTLYVQYRVKAGDTLNSIAQRYQVKVEQITQLNQMENANRLMKGKLLKIPADATLLAQLASAP